MKRSLTALLAAVTFTLATAAFAGGYAKHGDCHHGKRGMHHARLEQKLDLSADQKTAIDEIYAAAKQQRKAGFAGMADQRRAMLDLNPADPDYESQVAEFAKQKAARVEQQVLAHGAMQAQVHALLTPEQREKLAQLQQEARERFSKRHRSSEQQRSSGDPQ